MKASVQDPEQCTPCRQILFPYIEDFPNCFLQAKSNVLLLKIGLCKVLMKRTSYLQYEIS